MCRTFSALFLIECLVKILARGFIVGKHTYLHDAWNYLDLIVVIIGVMDFFPSDGSSNLSALRSLRVMRPLRLVTKFQDLKDNVIVLISCIPDLSNAVGLVAFILLVFGILGVQLFAGALRGVCFSIEDGQIRNSPSPCGFLMCHEGYKCLQLGENPSRGVVTFDYIGASMMTVYQVMTYEGWNDAMYAVQDSVHPITYLYFLGIIVTGPIFALQLFLVVISNKYNLVKAEEAAEKERTEAASKEEEEKALKLSSNILGMSETENETHGSCSVCGKDVYSHETRVREDNAYIHEKCLGQTAGKGASKWAAGKREHSDVTTCGHSFGIHVPDTTDKNDSDSTHSGTLSLQVWIQEI
jgi:hypothetical protein